MAIKHIKTPDTVVHDVEDARIPSLTGNAGKVLGVNSSANGLEWKSAGGGAGTLNTTATTAQSTNASESLGGSVTLHKVSKTGSYNDLNNKPTIPAAQVQSDWNATSGMGVILNKPSIPSAPGTLVTNNTAAQATSASEALSGTVNLHKVAKTGTYSDLIGTPSIPSAPGTLITNATSAQTESAGEAMSGNITLHKVSKTGSYSDLNDKPTIPTVPTISTNVVTDKASDVKTSSPKSVYNEIHPAFATTIPSGGMLPNVLYKLGTKTGSVSFTMASATDNTIVNHWYWTFETSTTAPTITWPAAITSWNGGSAPTIAANKHYEISVLNGVGAFMEV